jgi:ankyrin repeat protein
MNRNTFLSFLLHSHIFRLAVIPIIALAWSFCAFCDTIHDAVKVGQSAKVEALLKENPELLSSKDISSDGDTPLHLAARYGRRDMAELLPTHGADVNAKGYNGETPFHWAAQAGNNDAVELLLTHGANVNAKDDDGDTPLSLAIENGRKDVAELLLRHGGGL